MYKHKKFAITGGPCAGKTTAMQRIVDEFTEKGYKVFVINETATELISGGIKPFGNNPIDLVEFQGYVLDLQLAKEKLYEKVASCTNQNTIILCDRGIMDNRAYINDSIFHDLLKERELNEMELSSSYDAVLHLVTAAIGAEKYYTTANNTARTETKEEAAQLDKKTLNSWLGHKKICIIDNEVGFDEKINNVIKTIYQELGEPYPIQEQYKYLISSNCLSNLENIPHVKLELEQFFIDINDDSNTMIRKTTKDGDSTYSKTIKKDTDIPHERITTSKKITNRDYYELLDKIEYEPIRKDRYCFTYNNEYYNLDVFDDNLCILEVNLTNKSKGIIEIPPFLEVEEDITDDLNYRNINLYKRKNNKVKKLGKKD